MQTCSAWLQEVHDRGLHESGFSMRRDMEYPTIGLMSIVITESLMTMALFVNIESFLAASLVLLVNLAQLHQHGNSPGKTAGTRL